MSKKLENLVISFNEGKVSRKEILSNISDLILKIPDYFKVNDQDVKKDFYLFIIDKIEKILSLYRIKENCSFKTWFILVLKNEFTKFNLKTNEKKFINILDYEDSYCYENSYYNKYIDDYLESSDDNRINNNIFSDTEKKIINYKFGINESEEFKETINIIKNRLDKKKIYEDIININYVKLLKIHSQILSETEKDKIEKLKQKEKRIRLRKRRLERIYDNIRLFPSNGWVGSKIGITAGTVSCLINRIKAKLIKNRISNLY